MLKSLIKKIPLIGLGKMCSTQKLRREFLDSTNYWEHRYSDGGNSGVGSYGKFAEFKAEILNGFVAEQRVHSVIEHGCGDGSQLRLARYPSYLGFDISAAAVERCRQMFAGDPSKAFLLARDYSGQTAELALSLDVIYHLVEDDVFASYMRRLFASATRFVVIYSSNTDDNVRLAPPPHIKHRQFSLWVQIDAPGWKLLREIPNRFPYRGNGNKGSFSNFYIYHQMG
jgi:hypothetical protein